MLGLGFGLSGLGPRVKSKPLQVIKDYPAACRARLGLSWDCWKISWQSNWNIKCPWPLRDVEGLGLLAARWE